MIYVPNPLEDGCNIRKKVRDHGAQKRAEGISQRTKKGRLVA